MGGLRLLLALSVVCAHGGGLFGYDMATGRGAVEAFFMLSGFLMQLVLSKRYDPRKDVFLFYTNRALRIYPTYLLALLFAWAVSAFLWRYSTGLFSDLRSAADLLNPVEWVEVVLATVFIFGQDAYVFLNLGPDGLQFTTEGVGNASSSLFAIPPAWSISLELTFYLLAPFLACLPTRALLAIMGLSFALRVVFWSIGLDHDPWTNRFFPLELLLFVAGMLSYRWRGAIVALAGRLPLAPTVPLILAGVLLVHPALIVAGRVNVPWEVVYLGFYLFVFCALPLLFEATGGSRRDAWLGSFSFPVYLLHWPIIAAYNTFAGPELDVYRSTARTLVCTVLTLAVAYVVVILVEVPLERLRRARRRHPPAPEGATLERPATPA